MFLAQWSYSNLLERSNRKNQELVVHDNLPCTGNKGILQRGWRSYVDVIRVTQTCKTALRGTESKRGAVELGSE